MASHTGEGYSCSSQKTLSIANSSGGNTPHPHFRVHSLPRHPRCLISCSLGRAAWCCRGGMKERPAQGRTEVSTWVCGTLPFFQVLIICKPPYHPLPGPFYQMSQTEGLKAHCLLKSSTKQSPPTAFTERPLRGSSMALHCSCPGWVCGMARTQPQVNYLSSANSWGICEPRYRKPQFSLAG